MVEFQKTNYFVGFWFVGGTDKDGSPASTGNKAKQIGDWFTDSVSAGERMGASGEGSLSLCRFPPP